MQAGGREGAIQANGFTNTKPILAAREAKVPKVVLVYATMPDWRVPPPCDGNRGPGGATRAALPSCKRCAAPHWPRCRLEIDPLRVAAVAASCDGRRNVLTRRQYCPAGLASSHSVGFQLATGAASAWQKRWPKSLWCVTDRCPCPLLCRGVRSCTRACYVRGPTLGACAHVYAQPRAAYAWNSALNSCWSTPSTPWHHCSHYYHDHDHDHGHHRRGYGHHHHHHHHPHFHRQIRRARPLCSNR